MQKLILLIIIISTLGCTPSFILSAPNPLAEKNKDILLLSIFIRDHLRQTNGSEFSLNDLQKIDTLKRIAGNFEKIQLKKRAGYISYTYTFSATRNLLPIKLSDSEKEILFRKIWQEKDSDKSDGEIRYAFGERFYNIYKIIIKK